MEHAVRPLLFNRDSQKNDYSKRHLALPADPVVESYTYFLR